MKLLTLTDRLWGLGMTTAVYGAIVPAMFLLSSGIGHAPARSRALKTFDVVIPRPEPEVASRTAGRKLSPEPIATVHQPALPKLPLTTDPGSNNVAGRAPAEPATLVPAPPAPLPATAEVLTEPPAPAADARLAQRIYARRLWLHIAAHRPAGIRIEGTSLIAFTVTRAGVLENVSLGQPSGNPMLDRLAIRTIRRAAPLPVPPAELAEAQLRFTIPFSFR